jgi:hypothetical protein
MIFLKVGAIQGAPAKSPVRQPCRLSGQKPADLLKQQRLLVLLALEFVCEAQSAA